MSETRLYYVDGNGRIGVATGMMFLTPEQIGEDAEFQVENIRRSGVNAYNWAVSKLGGDNQWITIEAGGTVATPEDKAELMEVLSQWT